MSGLPEQSLQRSFWLGGAGGPVKFRERLERLGPTFVKFGQFLALRPDLVPDDYSLELMRLFDEAPPFPWSQARAILEEDLSQAAFRSFAYIEPLPIGAASLAQVHAARLRSGEQVAVKIQRPHLREHVLRDLARLRRFLRFLRLSNISFGFDPSDLMRDLTAWMLCEIDFGRELRNLTRLYNESTTRYEWFPRPYEELSGARVVTSELLRGTRVSTLVNTIKSGDERTRAKWRASGIDLDEFARNLLNSTLRQIFHRRFFHADLHPGNLLVMQRNAVGFVDFGLCDEIDERVGKEQMRYFVALYESNLDGMYRALTDLLIPGEFTDPEAFRQDFFQVVGQSSTAGSEGDRERSPVGQALSAVMRAVRRHDYRIPPRLLSMYRALLGADTIAHQLGTAVTLRDVGRVVFEDLQREEFRHTFDSKNVERFLLDVHQLVTRSPHQINQVLADLADGRFYLNVNAAERTRTALIRNRRTKILVTAIISVGFALLAASPHQFPAYDLVIRSVLLGGLLVLYILILIQWNRLS